MKILKMFLVLLLVNSQNSFSSTETKDFREILRNIHDQKEKIELDSFHRTVRLNKIFKNKPVAKIEADWGASLGFILSIQAKEFYREHITESTLINQDEVDQFEEIITHEYEMLKSSIIDYVLDNKNEILQLKYMILSAIHLAKKHVLAGDNLSRQELNLLLNAIEDLKFSGTQSVNICEVTNYQAYTDKHTFGMKIALFGVPLFGPEFGAVVKHKKRSETVCHISDESIVNVKPEDTILVYDLGEFDNVIKRQMQLLHYLWILTFTEPSSPGFDSPYFR
jgi:hypothetical protein